MSYSSSSDRRPQVSDYVKIGNIVDSEIIDISNNIITLQDGRKLLYNTEMNSWMLTVKSSEVTFYEYNVGDISVYPMINILVNAEHKDFQALCSTNRAMRNICSGKGSAELIKKYGSNLTEEMYHNRVKKWIHPDIIEFRDTKKSWKEFYEQYIKSKNILNEREHLNDADLMEDIMVNGNIIELILFTLESNYIFDYDELEATILNNHVKMMKYILKRQPNIIIPQELINDSTMYGNLSMAKFFASMTPPRLPSQDAVNMAKQNRHTQILEFLATLNPSLLPTN